MRLRGILTQERFLVLSPFVKGGSFMPDYWIYRLTCVDQIAGGEWVECVSDDAARTLAALIATEVPVVEVWSASRRIDCFINQKSRAGTNVFH